MAEIAVENMVRIGRVDSADAEKRTVRVVFGDKNGLKSAPLKVISSPPFIPAKDAPQRTEEAEGGVSAGSYDRHSHGLRITPWMPSEGDLVLCVFLAGGGGDGFVIGGI